MKTSDGPDLPRLPYLAGPDAGRSALPAELADVDLWAFDVDGTLAGADSVITDRTIAALRALADSGAHVALVTGRAAIAAELDLDRAGIDGHVVGYGGAFVRRRRDGAVLHERPMDVAEVAAVAEFGAAHGLRPAFFTATDLVMDSPGPDADFLDAANPGAPMNYGGWAALAGTPRAHLVGKVMLQGPAERLDALTPAILDAFPRMERSLDRWFEANAEGCSKWDGLIHVLADLGIDAERVAGAGDGGNDLTWLSRIGWPMSVANARPEVTALARLHLGHHDDEVVAALVEDVVALRTGS